MEVNRSGGPAGVMNNMKRISRDLVLLISLGAPLALVNSVQAQIGAGFLADPESMDTVSGASTGSAGGSNFAPINRAQNAVNRANNPQQGNPFGPGGGGSNPFGPGAGAAGGNPFGPGAGAAGGGAPNPFGAAPSPFGAPGGNFNDPFGGGGAGTGGFSSYVPPPTLTAWGGERITCHRTGEILQDAREISILADSAGQYYDDGESGNDAAAGDNIYTNITVSSNFISPEANVIKTKLIRTLQFVSPPPDSSQEEESLESLVLQDLQALAAESGVDLKRYVLAPRQTSSLQYFNNLTPMQFSQVSVATTEPLSPLPKLVDLEQKQDEKIREWAIDFLDEYRMNPGQMESEFYPTFIPPPPRAPNIPLPTTFTPVASGEEGDGTNAPGGQFGAGGDPFAGDVTGEPVGNASSRYF